MLKSFFTVVSSAVITVTSSSGFVLHLWCVNWMLKGLGNLCFHLQDFPKIPREPRMSLLYSQLKLKKNFCLLWNTDAGRFECRKIEAGTVDSEGKTVRLKVVSLRAKEIDRKWDSRQWDSEVKPKAVWCFIVNHTLYIHHECIAKLYTLRKKYTKAVTGAVPFKKYKYIPLQC